MTTRFRHTLAALAGAAALVGLSVAAAPAAHAATHEPIDCNPGKVFLVTTPTSGQTDIRVGTFGPGAVTFAPFVSQSRYHWNTTGYNPVDGYLYGLTSSDNHLLQIGGDGSIVDLGAVGLTTTNTVVGGFTPSGTFVVFTDFAVHQIDVTTRQVTSATITGGTPKLNDAAYHDGYMWALKPNAGDPVLQRIDPDTGVMTTAPVADPPADLDSGSFGGAFAYGNGDLGFFQQRTGVILRVRVTANGGSGFAAKVVSTQATSVTAPGSDTAACLSATTDLRLTKAAPADAVAGTAVPYTITVHNDGPQTSSGWSVSDTLPASLIDPQTSTPGCSITGAVLTCFGGVLARGANATIEVRATAAAAGVVSNSATVTANDSDPNPANDTDTAVTTVRSAPHGDWGTANSGIRMPGSSGTSPLVNRCFTPAGCDFGPGLTFTDHATNGGSFTPGTSQLTISGEGTVGTCTTTTTTVSCTVTRSGHVAKGATISAQDISWRVSPDAPPSALVFSPGTHVDATWVGDDPANDVYPIYTPAEAGAPLLDWRVAGGIGGAAVLLGGAFVSVRHRRRTTVG